MSWADASLTDPSALHAIMAFNERNKMQLQIES